MGRQWIAAFMGLALASSGVLAQAPSRADWALKTERAEGAPEARIVARTGDIDNLGFGWSAGFDPFSGRSTPAHAYPWDAPTDDPAGTDRIMVGSGHADGAACPGGSDGYAFSTTRADTQPQAIEVDLGEMGAPPQAILVQMFIDDFQARQWGAKYQVSLNGERLPLFEHALNAVDQTGPIGKLVSIRLFPEQFRLLEGGKASFLIDDPETGACDGYAVDFLRVLIDPNDPLYSVTFSGRVVDDETGRPIKGAIVMAALGQAETDAQGRYRIENVPAGLVAAQGAHPDYEPEMKLADLAVGATEEIEFRLKKRKAEAASLGETLDATGRVVIPGIYFDTDKATLRPDSESALLALFEVAQARPDTRFAVEGHTDAQGDDAYNLKLSRERAESVVRWLVERGVRVEQLKAEGYGEMRPVAANDTAPGRQLNRRVEISIID